MVWLLGVVVRVTIVAPRDLAASVDQDTTPPASAKPDGGIALSFAFMLDFGVRTRLRLQVLVFTPFLLIAMLQRLFPPSCPCDVAAKAWIEERLGWLREEFGGRAFDGRRMVLPTAEYFPDTYDGSRRSVRAILDRVCEYMHVVPELVRLRFTSDAGKLWLVNSAGHYLPPAAGTYEEGEGTFTIRIDSSQLDEPMTLVGTLAHELAHVRLLGEGRAMQEEYDNELLTDLTVVYFGLGIFLANRPRNWDAHYTKWPGTDLNKPEYMTPPMFGYALAHLAWFQGERWPAWAKYLHSNARPEFKQAVRFLFQTGESTFKPARV